MIFSVSIHWDSAIFSVKNTWKLDWREGRWLEENFGSYHSLWSELHLWKGHQHQIDLKWTNNNVNNKVLKIPEIHFPAKYKVISLNFDKYLFTEVCYNIVIFYNFVRLYKFQVLKGFVLFYFVHLWFLPFFNSVFHFFLWFQRTLLLMDVGVLVCTKTLNKLIKF